MPVFQMRPELLKIALTGNIPHKSVHLHAGFLTIGVRIGEVSDISAYK